MSSVDGARIAQLYPRLDDVRVLVHERDPADVFRGPFLERVIGI